MNIGVITARGESKGIPGKNIKPCAGMPLILHTVRAALRSKLVYVALSTDSEEIEKVVAEQVSDDFLFIRRPPELAEDTTPHLPVMIHALKEIESSIGPVENVMILQPTSPLRLPEDIDGALRDFTVSDADSLVSVTEGPTKYNPEWLLQEDPDLGLRIATGRAMRDRIRRRQNFPPYYLTNGAIYLFREALLRHTDPSLYGAKVMKYVMPAERSVSIDDIADFEEAEKLLLARNKNI